jgi:hypothetical protein
MKDLDLACEAGLDGQEGLGGPHGHGGDGQAFDHLVGVVAQDGPVLEGAGLALVAVGDDEAALVVAAGVEDREPLAAGPEPAPATAAQARQGHLFGGPPRTEGPGDPQPLAAPSGSVLADRADRISVQDDTSAAGWNVHGGTHGSAFLSGGGGT